jgi:hypothetical protein
MLRDYEQNKIDRAARRATILLRTSPRPDIAIFSKGNDQDDTANRAAALQSDALIQRLTGEIRAVEHANAMCRCVRNGKTISKIIDLVYKKGTHTMAGAAQKCGIRSEVWAGKLAARYFQWINDYFQL